jgi:putative salt-induced outer membrane protein YdiY
MQTSSRTFTPALSFRRLAVRNLVTLPFLASLALLPAWADQIVMKNGDRVTGSVVKKDGKNLTIKTDQLGAVTVSWDQVTSIKTDKPVNVVLGDGRTAKGTLTTTGAMVEIAAQPPISVAPADIATIRDDDEQKAFERLNHPNWGQLWAGNASLGLAGTEGNAEALTFTLGATIARLTNNDKTSLYFNAIDSSAKINGTDSQTAEAVRGGWAYNHNVSPRLFVGVYNDYSYDKFQDLNLRFVLGGNFGYHLMKTKRSQLDVLGGFDYIRSNYFTPVTTPPTPSTPAQSAGEIMAGEDYTLKLNGNTSLVESFRFFDSLENTSASRMNFDVGASTKIAKWLTWNVSLSDRYVNRPAAGRKENDFLYSTGIGVTFAR